MNMHDREQMEKLKKLDGWRTTERQANKIINECMYVWIDGERQRDRQIMMDRWTDRKTEKTNRWMDGWMDK